MATPTQNTYVGDGVTTLYSFTFPYIEPTDVYVSVDGVNLTRTTEYTYANATTISLATAPAVDAEVKIYRQTDSSDIKWVFFPGSAIRASDLNDNFTQNLYVTQEAEFGSGTANDDARKAAQAAEEAAQSAEDASNAAASVQSTADAALTTANQANTTANSAVGDANTALSAASSAQVAASDAEVKADQALSAVLEVVPVEFVATVGDIPTSPSNGDQVQVQNSTGIESFSPLTGLPAGFVGDPGLYVVLSYSTSTTSWIYERYNANDPDDRYSGALNALSTSGGTITGDLYVDGALVSKGSGGQPGAITLNCENNSHGVMLQAPPHSAAASYTITLPETTGQNGQVLSTDGTGSTSWATVVTDIDLDTYPSLP